MEKKKFFIATLLVAAAVSVAVVSCKKEKMETSNPKENVCFSDYNNFYRDTDNPPVTSESIPPIITTATPIFPCEVLFVINKEYELAQNNNSYKTEYLGIPIADYSKAKYLELRLMELYPNLAYEGFVDDSQDFYDSVNTVYNAYLLSHPQSMDTNDMKGDNTSYFYENKEEELLSMSEEQLFQYLKLTENEISLFYFYKDLAKMSSFATLKEILGSGVGQTRFCWANFGCICILAVGNVSNMFFSAMACKSKTEAALQQYYYNYNDYMEGGRGGAFKHICVSMLLRRYLSITKAFLIMDVVYEGITNQNDNARDTHMDLHNNMVGRETKYWTFRGSYFGDMFDYNLWISRIYSFVQNGNNGAYRSWQINQSFWQLAWDRIIHPCPNQYIYYEY